MPYKDMEKRRFYARRWHHTHREKVLGWSRARREDNRAIITAAKDRPCADCAVDFPSYVMQFDHRPGELKLFVIGAKGPYQTIINLLAEIAKCDVVCANCHCVRTYQRAH
jgi:hypothetical protein